MGFQKKLSMGTNTYVYSVGQSDVSIFFVVNESFIQRIADWIQYWIQLYTPEALFSCTHSYTNVFQRGGDGRTGPVAV